MRWCLPLLLLLAAAASEADDIEFPRNVSGSYEGSQRSTGSAAKFGSAILNLNSNSNFVVRGNASRASPLFSLLPALREGRIAEESGGSKQHVSGKGDDARNPLEGVDSTSSASTLFYLTLDQSSVPREDAEETAQVADGDEGFEGEVASAATHEDKRCLSLLHGELVVRETMFVGSRVVRMEVSGVYVSSLGLGFLSGLRRGAAQSAAREAVKRKQVLELQEKFQKIEDETATSGDTDFGAGRRRRNSLFASRKSQLTRTDAVEKELQQELLVLDLDEDVFAVLCEGYHPTTRSELQEVLSESVPRGAKRAQGGKVQTLTTGEALRYLLEEFAAAESRLLFGNATARIAGTAKTIAGDSLRTEDHILASSLWLHFDPVRPGHNAHFADMFNSSVTPPHQTETDRVLRQQRLGGGDGRLHPHLSFDADLSFLLDYGDVLGSRPKSEEEEEEEGGKFDGKSDGKGGEKSEKSLGYSKQGASSGRTVLQLALRGRTRPLDRIHSRAALYAALAVIAAAAEVYLLLRQMKVADSSQAAAARVSSKALVALAAGDAYVAIVHLSVAVAVPEPLFHVFALAAFVKFAGFSLFTLRMLLSVLTAGSNNLQNRTSAGGNLDAVVASGEDRSSRSIAVRVALVQGVRRVGETLSGQRGPQSTPDPGKVYCHFYMVLLAVALLAWVLGDGGIRVMVTFVGFGWGWPQIGNNAWRDTTTNKASGNNVQSPHALTAQSCFDAKYALAAMAARAFVPLYLWGCPSNVARVETNPDFVFFLVSGGKKKTHFLCFFLCLCRSVCALC
jgi:hypothetical protein